jgi:hypothetical protein
MSALTFVLFILPLMIIVTAVFLAKKEKNSI